MEKKNLVNNILTYSSIFIALLAIVSEKYRLFLIEIYEKQDNEIKRLNEKLKIHGELIDIKSRMTILERKVFKK